MNLIYQNTTPLAAGAQLIPSVPSFQTSVPWFSAGNVSSGQSVRVAVYSDQPGQLSLQQTDDPGLPNMTYEVARVPVSGKVAAHLEYGVTSQFWRFVYTNGPAAQTVMDVVAFSTSDLNPALLIELRKINFQLAAIRSDSDDISQF